VGAFWAFAKAPKARNDVRTIIFFMRIMLWDKRHIRVHFFVFLGFSMKEFLTFQWGSPLSVC
jgi:hypothetical protein